MRVIDEKAFWVDQHRDLLVLLAILLVIGELPIK